MSNRQRDVLPSVNEGFCLYLPTAVTSSLRFTAKHKPSSCPQDNKTNPHEKTGGGKKKGEKIEAKQTSDPQCTHTLYTHTHSTAQYRWSCESQTGMQEKTRQIQMIQQLCCHIRE